MMWSFQKNFYNKALHKKIKKKFCKIHICNSLNDILNNMKTKMTNTQESPNKAYLMMSKSKRFINIGRISAKNIKDRCYEKTGKLFWKMRNMGLTIPYIKPFMIEKSKLILENQLRFLQNRNTKFFMEFIKRIKWPYVYKNQLHYEKNSTNLTSKPSLSIIKVF